MNWTEILQALNAGALVTFAALLALGKLVPIQVVREHIIAPMQERIAALERVAGRKDEQAADLARMQAEAIKAQGVALELSHQWRGGGHA